MKTVILVTPLAVALLLNLIESLRTTIGRERWADPPLAIITATDGGASGQRPARHIWSNWPDLGHRDAVIAQGFEYLGITASVDARPKHQTPHGRRLEVRFTTGEVLSLRLDQGVSYWRFAHSPQSSRGADRFDFGADLATQARYVAELSGHIEGGAQGTQLFLAVRGPS